MFILCYRGKTASGKEEIYPIYESSLKNIDMYTSYKKCTAKTELFRLLPSDVKNFILSKFNENNYNEIKGDFFIRKSCYDIRKGRTDLDVLYNFNSDVIYADNNDIYFSFCNLNKYNNDIKKMFFKELYNTILLKESKLLSMIDENNEQNDSFERYTNRLESIIKSQSNLKVISDYIYKNYELKRKALTLLKKYTCSNELSLIDSALLENRIKNRGFSITYALINMKKMLSIENKRLASRTNRVALDAEKKAVMHEDDIEHVHSYEDDSKEDFDDFLGPKEANDKRYWGIN